MKTRVCIYPKDLCARLGFTERKAQREIRAARMALRKKKHQILSIKEYCAYADVDESYFEGLK